MEAPGYTVVVPVHDDATTLAELVSRMDAALAGLGVVHRWVLVDDASTDGSWEVIRDLATRPDVVGVRLARNVRQVRAFCAGVATAGPGPIVTIDADLESAPEDVVALVAAHRRGHDMVNGGRPADGRPRGRRWATHGVNVLGAVLAGGGRWDVGSGFTVMDRPVAEALVRAVERRPTQLVKPVLVRAAQRPTQVAVSGGPGARPSGYPPRVLVGAVLDMLLVHGRPVTGPGAVLAVAAGVAGGGRARRIARVAAALLGAAWVGGGPRRRRAPLYEVAEVVGPARP